MLKTCSRSHRPLVPSMRSSDLKSLLARSLALVLCTLSADVRTCLGESVAFNDVEVPFGCAWFCESVSSKSKDQSFLAILFRARLAALFPLKITSKNCQRFLVMIFRKSQPIYTQPPCLESSEIPKEIDFS